jgi:two-component system, chemotaxis family, CheB/CheR fusion protein
MNDITGAASKPVIVGIGASAGGLEALKQFFLEVPADSGLAYVVVVHLMPEQPSLLAELLQPFGSMPVQQVTQDLLVEPDNVYVIPPGNNLSTIDSHLRLSRIEELRRQRAPIDHFFDTLAQTHGDRCVGVVLSGTGGDGSVGITLIKERGGLTIAQDPTEAAYDSMPRSAMATGMIDLVLPVKEMPRQILRIMQTAPRLAIGDDLKEQPESDRQVLNHIFAQVRARAGQDFSRYKPSTVLRRIRRRMQLHQREQLAGYLELLRADPNEVHLLAEELLITVTQFFRDPDTFEYVEKDIIPALFNGKSASDRIRIWSVGCATGEEPYSIAMLLLEYATRMEQAPPQLEIFGSDLHEDSLARAREGVYPDAIEAYVAPERLRRFFTKQDSVYRIRKELREIVVFAGHNLLKDPPFSRLDLVVCRNLLIYLQRETQDKVIELFHYALAPGGLLWLGSAETLDRTALFQPQSKPHGVYRRLNVPAPEPSLPVFPQTKIVRSRYEAGAAYGEPVASYGVLHQQMVERLALPSILVDQEFRIVHASEHAGRYLRVPGGELSASVFKLVREELRIELRTALQAASERGEALRTDPAELVLDGAPRQVVMQVRPAQDRDAGGLILVVFDEMAAEETGARARPVSPGEESELERTKRRLRTVIEQYETAQEEMRAANEELQSTNEELRSTMEELETSKEELQSMNEELQTVNQENRHKVEELSQLTGDLNNLMAATEIATLFLDRDLRILRVTPRAGDLFHIRTRDRGRPLTDLRRLVAYEQLEEDARGVFERLKPVQREVQGERGEWYLARVLPYRSASDQIQGIVITLVEITQLKQAELALRESEARFRALVTASSQVVWTTDAAGQMIEDSPSWRAFTGQTPEQWRGEGWLEAVHPKDRDAVHETWRRCLATVTPLDSEFRLRHARGGWRWTHVHAVPLSDEQGRVRGWVGMNTDISDRKAAEERLRAEDRRKDEFLATLSHELRNPLAPMRTGMDLLKELLPAEPEIRRIGAIIERQIQHMTHLVDDLLDIARIKSGRVELREQRVDLRDAVRSAIGDVSAEIEAARHRLSTDQASEPLMVDGDAMRLAQVVTNLLHNAVKYTPDGGEIRITTRRDNGDAVLVVGDDGIGLEPEMLNRIFDTFAQGPHDPARAPAGLGLGLTLVRRLIELHGGTVEARSGGLGEGSEFIVRLPLASEARLRRKAAGIGAERAAGTAPASRGPTTPKRVLVVDDNPDVAESLALALELVGHEVRQAGDAREALDLTGEFAPQVVVLDIGLPDMNGYELARALRKQPETADALLIAVTGYGQSNDRDKALAAGIDHHLTKPAELTALLTLIDTGR